MNPAMQWPQQAPAAAAPSPWGAPLQPAAPSMAPSPWGAPAGPGPGSMPGGFGAPAGAAPGYIPQAPQGAAPVSFDPSTFTEGGGLIDNVIVRFDDCKAIVFNYQGKSTTSAPAFRAMLTILDAQTGQPVQGQTPQEQVWTVGSLEDFTVTADGAHIVPLGTKTGLNKNSNFALLLQSAMNAGFPRNLLNGDVRNFNGLVAFVQRRKVERQGLKRDKDAREDSGVLCINDIRALPGGAQVQAPAQVPAQAPAPMAQAQAQPPAQPQAFAPPAQAQAQPQPQGFTPQNQTEATAANAVMLALSTNPQTLSAFFLEVFKATMQDQTARALAQDAHFITRVKGSPLNLPN